MEIDMSKVDGKIIDVSGPCSPLKGNMARNWAKKSQEMLIQGRIPAKAMRVL